MKYVAAAAVAAVHYSGELSKVWSVTKAHYGAFQAVAAVAAVWVGITVQ